LADSLDGGIPAYRAAASFNYIQGYIRTSVFISIHNSSVIDLTAINIIIIINVFLRLLKRPQEGLETQAGV